MSKDYYFIVNGSFVYCQTCFNKQTMSYVNLAIGRKKSKKPLSNDSGFFSVREGLFFDGLSVRETSAKV